MLLVFAGIFSVVERGEKGVNKPPVVDLNYTSYEGIRLENGVDAFLGMRFAAPPLGDLRWRAPIEPERMEGIQKATKLPPICIGLGMGYPTYGASEDCLFVNVWTPSTSTPSSKLPVWVFVSGGGYISLTNANWNGAEVVEKSGHNIVMVNFNYRVGLFGFLASERIREDGDLNVGLLDQRMLLQWVKQHIAQFGGDPEHVVIHGASAGAGSVAMHLVAYGGKDEGLFKGAVLESGFFPAQPRVGELEWQFERAVKQTGCGRVEKERQMDCLRGKDTGVLQGANGWQPFPGRREPPMPLFYWTPCVDGEVITDFPYRLFREGKFIDVPMLVGTDENEGSLFAPNAASPSAVANFLANNYPSLTPNDTSAILAQYSTPLPPLPQHAPWYPTASLAYGEATFTCPTLSLLTQLSPSSRARFAYLYSVHDRINTALGLGVPHLFEAAAIFGPDNIGGHGAESYWTYNAGIVPVVMKYWISFVRALDPNVFREEGSPEWRVWGEEGRGGGERLVFETGRTRMEEVGEGERMRCRFWEGMSGKLEQRRR